ncbi:MAG: HAMP domain-containing histidine kinase [Acidobacteriia bacterium]|nr:HAMP domain-containing histidine kinase [Terriglobia bacterium]
MKPAPAEGEIAARDERRELLSELFHALNQPLTTLRCALELSLQRPHSEEEYRYTMEAALQQAENVTRLTCGIRELLEGDDPGDHPQAVALDASVQEAVLDWLPVAEAAQITLLAQNLSPCQVRFEPQRLRRALFHLQEFVLHSAAGDAIVKIDLAQQGGEALLRVATSQRDVSSGEGSVSCDRSESNMEHVQRRLGLAIARSIFEAAGGSFAVKDCEEQLVLEIRLARTAVPADAEQRSSGRGGAIQG